MTSNGTSIVSFRRLAGVGSMIVLFFNSGLLGRADLIVQRQQGGPMEYTSDNERSMGAAFELNIGYRIENVEVWINGGGPVDVSIGGLPFGALTSVNYTATFTPKYVPGPASWQGLGSLSWDAPPGEYSLVVTGGTIPLAEGFQGPFLDAPQPSNYFALESGVDTPADPFGLRIYGTPLTAVPEPSTYGVIGGAMLLGLACLRRRLRSSAAV